LTVKERGCTRSSEGIRFENELDAFESLRVVIPRIGTTKRINSIMIQMVEREVARPGTTQR